MLERALSGSPKYYRLLGVLLVLMGLGLAAYLLQLDRGLTITGMSRDVSWGIYIAQFTFLVGIAASAVMVVLPYCLHDVRAFGKITVLGEFLAVASITMCILFIVVDLGKPTRLLNVLLYPAPGSVLFWDMIVLIGYLVMNLLIGWNVLEAERKGFPQPRWVRPLIYVSIPWAVGIHTVTAFLYAGLPARHYWLTAIMAARFLASAFASGPALLILVAFALRKHTKFDPGRKAIDLLSQIVTYAMTVTVFFVGLEFFTAFYSRVPSGMETLQYLFAGLDGRFGLVPLMWVFVVLAVTALVLLINPATRKNDLALKLACITVFVSLWIEKGLGLVVAGFIPNPFGQVREYVPTVPELAITAGIWATGFFILTVLCRITVSVKSEAA